MGWTRVEVHTDELNARLAVIENEVRALLGEDTPKGTLVSGQLYFAQAEDNYHVKWPIMITRDGISVFKLEGE